MVKRILVIEDEPQTLEVFLECLQIEGFEVIGAENGQIGLQRVQEYSPDLIICDIMMPELDGYKVLIELRRNPTTSFIPFVFLTAKASDSDRQYGTELGAEEYLTKPCTIEDLLQAIARACYLEQ